MDSVLIKVIATAVWVGISSALGFFMAGRGRPYGVWKPLVHGLCFVFIAAGSVFSLMEVFAVNPLRVWSLVVLIVVALTVACNFIVGVAMLSAKAKNSALVTVHKTSTGLLAVALVAAAVFSVAKI